MESQQGIRKRGSTPVPAPPWEALPLVAQALDPKSLALASCVSKSWRAAMSANHLWRPILLARYPSAALHLTTSNNPISHRALFALLRSASPRHRRLTPRISLDDLVFVVDVFRAGDGSPVLSLAKPGEDMNPPTGVFHFDVEVGDGREIAVGAAEELRAAWTVVLKDCRGAFAMMEGGGRGRSVGTSAVWFSEELPGLACCSASAGGCMMAELGLEFCGRSGDYEEEKRRVKRVRMGLMGVFGCRYMGLHDGLLYLQSFLLPSSF